LLNTSGNGESSQKKVTKANGPFGFEMEIHYKSGMPACIIEQGDAETPKLRQLELIRVILRQGGQECHPVIAC
jgi:hypothetical protein